MPFHWRLLKAGWFTTVLVILQVGVAAGALVVILTHLLPHVTWPRGATVLEVTYQRVEERAGMAMRQAEPVFRPEDALLVRGEIPAITEAAALVVQPLVALMVDDRPYLVRSAGATDPGYFRLWALEAVAGTLFGAAEMAQGAPVAVISEAAARQLFGSAEDALDRELMLLSVEEGLLLQGLLAGFPSGTTPPPRAVFRVVGVYRFPSADPETVDLRRPEIIVPMGWLTAQHGKPAGPFSDPFADVLYVSAPMEQELAVQQALEVLLSPLLTERRRLQGGEEARSRSSWQLEVVRGGQAQLLREQHRARAAVVSGLVFAAVLAAGVALVTGNLVRMSGRRRAIGLARVLGASQRRIVQSAVVESMAIALVGGMVGLAASWPLEQLAAPLSDFGAGGTTLFGARLAAYGFCLVVTLIGGLLAGWYPAWEVSRGGLAEQLREEV